MKTENFYGQVQYQAPRVKMIKLIPRGHFLQQVSPYGELGAAGGVFDPYNTNDYGDELL